MTDLEKHVNQPGRSKLVKQVRAKIDELGIEYIFFQFKNCDCPEWSNLIEKQFINQIFVEPST